MTKRFSNGGLDGHIATFHAFVTHVIILKELVVRGHFLFNFGLFGHIQRFHKTVTHLFGHLFNKLRGLDHVAHEVNAFGLKGFGHHTFSIQKTGTAQLSHQSITQRVAHTLESTAIESHAGNRHRLGANLLLFVSRLNSRGFQLILSAGHRQSQSLRGLNLNACQRKTGVFQTCAQTVLLHFKAHSVFKMVLRVDVFQASLHSGALGERGNDTVSGNRQHIIIIVNESHVIDHIVIETVNIDQVHVRVNSELRGVLSVFQSRILSFDFFGVINRGFVIGLRLIAFSGLVIILVSAFYGFIQVGLAFKVKLFGFIVTHFIFGNRFSGRSIRGGFSNRGFLRLNFLGIISRSFTLGFRFLNRGFPVSLRLITFGDFIFSTIHGNRNVLAFVFKTELEILIIEIGQKHSGLDQCVRIVHIFADHSFRIDHHVLRFLVIFQGDSIPFGLKGVNFVFKRIGIGVRIREDSFNLFSHQQKSYKWKSTKRQYLFGINFIKITVATKSEKCYDRIEKA